MEKITTCNFLQILYLDVERLKQSIDFPRFLWYHIDTEGDGADEKGRRPIWRFLMSIYGISVDVSRGFDVLRGSKVLAHFDTYAEARAFADAAQGRWLRYWAAK